MSSSSSTTKWKLSSTRKVTSSCSLSMFNPSKPLNMLKNKSKSQSHYFLSGIANGHILSSSSPSSSSSKMTKSKSAEVVGRHQQFQGFDFDEEKEEEEVKQKKKKKDQDEDKKKKDLEKKKKKEEEKIEELKNKWSKNVAKTKRSKYGISSSSSNSVLKDLKNYSSSKISSVKSSLDYLIGQKLGFSSPKSGGLKNPMYQYGGLENEPPTPVKMYSPFTIESPGMVSVDLCSSSSRSSKSDLDTTPKVVQEPKRGKRKGLSKLTSNKVNPQIDRIRSQLVFSSPTGRFKEEIESINCSMNEFSVLEHQIRSKMSLANQNPSSRPNLTLVD